MMMMIIIIIIIIHDYIMFVILHARWCILDCLYFWKCVIFNSCNKDIKGVIRSRNLKTGNTRRANNGQQNTTQKTKD
jgi:hypothetical protein